MAYATIDDVTDIYGPLSDAEVLKAARLLEFAEAMVRQQVARVDARLAEGSLEPDVVARVVTESVVRVLHNPEGRRQFSQTRGPFTESWTVDNAVSSGALYLSSDELLSLAPRSKRLRAGSIRIAPGWR